MKIAVCEDEKIFSDIMLKIVSDFFECREEKAEISLYTDGIPLVADYMSGVRYDIIFFDIQLENSDGMEIAAKLRDFDKRVAFIFVTGLENRVFDGYAVSAFDYIVKPTVSQRLTEVLERFMQERQGSQISVMTHSGDTVILQLSDILWIESSGRGTEIYTEDNVIETVVPIGKISVRLPSEKFIEIHKSVYVQTAKIKCIKSDSVEICTGKILPMSRRKRKTVMEAVMTSMRGR